MSQEFSNYNTVIVAVGKDQAGIVAALTTVLAEANVNIADISQKILEDIFTIVMLVDTSQSTIPDGEIKSQMKAVCDEYSLTLNFQHKEIFEAMHRI